VFRRAVVLLFAAALLPAPGLAQAPDVTSRSAPEAGVAETLAVARAAQLADVRYALQFTIPQQRRDGVAGRATISFALASATAPLLLDFEPDKSGRLNAVEINGTTVPPTLDHGHVRLPAEALRRGVNRVVIDFIAGDVPLNRNDDFLYTIFVPARAHEAFPCFDQPDLKARWTLSLDVPDGWAAVGNGAETSRVSENGRTRVSFAETPPISTYLFAFASGKFSIEQAERSGRTFRMFHRETDAAKVARNRDELFNLHDRALRWLEDYTGIPFPFAKFDFVLIPGFQFGGMEHPGAVFYNANRAMLDESATQNQRLERANLISHETSHMWFGDLVTMKWFTDVWMKEVFANFIAEKIVNPSFPTVNHQLRFLHAYYPAAYGVDRTAGTNAIRQRLDNLKNAGTLYGAIVYQKAPIVMRQLETLVGSDRFRDGVRQYLNRYKFGNASWPDLIAILDERTPDDLASWSRAWVEEAGRPTINTELVIENNRITRLAFIMADPVQGRRLTWTQDIQVALGYADRVDLIPVRLTGTRVEVREAVGRPAPSYVLPNGAGIAYGELRLDRPSLRWLGTNLPAISDPLTRGAALVTLWDAMLNSELPSPRLVDLLVQSLPRESDELNVQRMLRYLQQAYWKFLSEGQRQPRAARIEQMLRDGITKAPTSSLKSAHFNALRDIAQTPPTLGWLTAVWRGEETIPGLTLAENDFITLAEELAIRQVPGWAAMLDEQVARTKNPDANARLRFLLPALSADLAERDRFFRSLSDVANRRREPWVVSGLAFLNHPLRSAAALQYITPSLQLLAEIQQTGDIFFPKDWMDATLGGHRSFEAARQVRVFLTRAPDDYPQRLRRIILSSGDDLFRASGLR
jgi:aminopeptidase N